MRLEDPLVLVAAVVREAAAILKGRVVAAVVEAEPEGATTTQPAETGVFQATLLASRGLPATLEEWEVRPELAVLVDQVTEGLYTQAPPRVRRRLLTRLPALSQVTMPGVVRDTLAARVVAEEVEAAEE